MANQAISSEFTQAAARGNFMATVRGMPPLIMPAICEKVKSSTTTETYAFLGANPRMREWVDQRIIDSFLEHSFTITNVPYANGIKIRWADLQADQTGQFNMRIKGMASEAISYIDDLVVDKLISATTDLCYDGTAFYGSTHTAYGDSGSQDNLLGTTGASLTIAGLANELELGYAAMAGFLDEGGYPFHKRGLQGGLTVVCPPEQYTLWMGLANNENVDYGVTWSTTSTRNQTPNRWRTLIKDIHMSARITTATDFYLFYVGSWMKPLIFQEFQPIQFTAVDSPTSEQRFEENVAKYGCDANWGVGYGLWQCSTKHVCA